MSRYARRGASCASKCTFSREIILARMIEATVRCRTGCVTVAWLLAAAASLAGSTDGAVDLVAEFAHAVPWRETACIDMGSAAARPLLLSGFSRADRREGERTYVYGTGDEARVRFFVAEPRDVDVAVAAWSIGLGANPPQRLTLSVNGQPAGEMVLPSVPADGPVVRIPGGMLKPGENRATFRAAYVLSPFHVQPMPVDRSRVSAIWDAIRFEGLAPGRRPSVAGKHALRIGTRAAVDYFLRARDGARLRIGRLAAVDEAADDGARLRVVVQVEGRPAERVADLGVGHGPVEVALPVATGEDLKLSLIAIGGPGDLLLVGPEVRGAELPPAGPRPVEPGPEHPLAKRPDIVVYLVDTLRADCVAPYAASAPTPCLARFARAAVTFENAVSQSSWTKPSVASLFTGVSPHVHRVFDKGQGLPDTAVSLAERMAIVGYQTAAVVANELIDEASGYAQGFESFRVLPRVDGVAARSDRVNEAVLEWLDERRDPTRPFFLYVHTMDPHAPYAPPPPFDATVAAGVVDRHVGFNLSVHGIAQGESPPSPEVIRDLRLLYDGEVAFNDDSFGSLLDDLEARGLYGGSVVLFLSDHGEELFDHGRFMHGYTLYQEQIHVPLLIKLPAGFGARTRVDARVRVVDVLPTLLDLAGAKVPSGIQGASLTPLLVGGNDDREASALLDDGTGDRIVEVLVSSGEKVVRTSQRGGAPPVIELYELDRDPGEKNDITLLCPVRAGMLAARAHGEALGTARWSRTDVPVDDDLDERLRALGYLD